MARLKYNDQYHTYWIDGVKATGVSTVAKGFQDSYNIDRKIKRDVAKGMARRPDLCTMVNALGDDESWETKKKIDKIATDAVEASGAWAKANHGTAKHTILERVHKGLSLDDVFDDRLREYAEAYQELIDRSGLTPVAHLTERFVVYPEQLIAGRLDCAYAYDSTTGKTLVGDFKVLLGDFKSGANAVKYPHSIVAQLGLYLNAPFLYNEETDEFDPAPLWGDTIIIAHVPDDLTQFGLWTIDANLARTVALAALERHRYIKSGADTLVRQWIVPAWPERPGDLEITIVPASSSRPPGVMASSASAAPVTAAVASTSPTLGEDKPTPAQRTVLNAVTTGNRISSGELTLRGFVVQSQPADPFDGLVDGYTAEPATPERRAWIIDRLRVLARYPGALVEVRQLWPEGLATLKASDRHTDADLDKIVDVICAVEGIVGATWETPPSKEKPSRTLSISSSPTPSNASSRQPETPNAPSQMRTPTTSGSASTASTNACQTSAGSSPDEGPAADPAAVTKLKTAYAALPQEQRAWINGIAHNAQKAGRTIHLGDNPSVRRYELASGLVTLAAGGCGQDDVVRGLIDAVTTPTTTPSHSTMPHERIAELPL